MTFPLGFAPRAIFQLPGLTQDEPFGPDWPGLERHDADTLTQSGAQSNNATSDDLASFLAHIAQAWNLPTSDPEHSDQLTADIANIGPTARIVLAGPAAITALASHMHQSTALDLADQTLLIADEPAERQLFGMAVAFIDRTRHARALSSQATADQARAASFPRATIALISSDAAPAVAEAARRLAAELVA